MYPVMSFDHYYAQFSCDHICLRSSTSQGVEALKYDFSINATTQDVVIRVAHSCLQDTVVIELTEGMAKHTTEKRTIAREVLVTQPLHYAVTSPYLISYYFGVLAS